MARLTDQEFEAKWKLGFADNTMQDITEKTFRDFMTDLKDSYANLTGLNLRQVKGATYPLPYTDSVSQIPAPYRIVGMLARAKVGTTAADAATLATPPGPVTLQLVADAAGPVNALVDEQPATTATVKAKWVAVAEGNSVLYEELGDQTDGAPTNKLLQDTAATKADLGPDGRLVVGQAPGAGFGLRFDYQKNEFALNDGVLFPVQTFPNSRVDPATGQIKTVFGWTTFQFNTLVQGVTYQSELLKLFYAVFQNASSGTFLRTWYRDPTSNAVAASYTATAPASGGTTDPIGLLVSVASADAPSLHIAPAATGTGASTFDQLGGSPRDNAALAGELDAVNSLTDGRRDLVSLANNRFNDVVLERHVRLSNLVLASNASSIAGQVLANGSTAVSAARTGSPAVVLAALQADIDGLSSYSYYLVRLQTTPVISTDVAHVLLTVTA